MPTTVPATGAVGLSAIETAFPNLASSNSLSSYRGRLPGMPTAAQSISYSQTRGLTAPTPTHALSAVGGTGVAVSSGGAFTLTAAPTNSMTLTLPSYLSTASSYHPGLAYYVASGSTLPQGFSLNASTGVVTVANANGASSAASFVVSACNSYSNSATIPLSLGACATPSASTSLGSVSLTSNTVTYARGSYFTDASGTAVTYTVTSNPNGNASIAGSTLSVVGASRGALYTVTVTATNGLGRTATNSISVAEGSAIKMSPSSSEGNTMGYIDVNNNVYTWGFNQWGNVGNGTYGNEKDLTAYETAGCRSNLVNITNSGSLSGRTVKAMTFGLTSMALDSTGAVHCWGYNGWGQVGNGTYAMGYNLVGVSQHVPYCTSTNSGSSLAGLTVVAMTTGGTYTGAGSQFYGACIALDSNGNVHGWGMNRLNCLLGFSQMTTTPTSLSATVSSSPIYGQVKAVAMSGLGTVLVLLNSGALYSWGANYANLTGTGATTQTVSTPTQVSTPAGVSFAAIACGQDMSMALTTAGAVYVWGNDPNGQMGLGSTGAGFSTPVLLTNGSLSGRYVTQIASGTTHCMALDSAGTVHVWGRNTQGQVPTQTGGDVSPPISMQVAYPGSLSGKTITSIIAGNQTCYAFDTSGGIHAWGDSSFGNSVSKQPCGMYEPPLQIV